MRISINLWSIGLWIAVWDFDASMLSRTVLACAVWRKYHSIQWGFAHSISDGWQSGARWQVFMGKKRSEWVTTSPIRRVA